MHPEFSFLFKYLIQVNPTNIWSYNDIAVKEPKLKAHFSEFKKLTEKEELEIEIEWLNNILAGILNS